MHIYCQKYSKKKVFQQQYTFIAKSLYKSVDWCDYKTELKQNLKIYIYWQSIFIAKSISTQISIHHWKYQSKRQKVNAYLLPKVFQSRIPSKISNHHWKYNWPLIWKKNVIDNAYLLSNVFQHKCGGFQRDNTNKYSLLYTKRNVIDNAAKSTPMKKNKTSTINIRRNAIDNVCQKYFNNKAHLLPKVFQLCAPKVFQHCGVFQRETSLNH